MVLFEFSRDFRIAFVAFSALLGALLLILGIVLAVMASKLRKGDQCAQADAKQDQATNSYR